MLAALGGYLAVQYDSSTTESAPRCVVRAADGDHTYEMSLHQAANAATISAVGTTRGMATAAACTGARRHHPPCLRISSSSPRTAASPAMNAAR
ncbi:hypothetical protein SMICM17S_12677 [Streptomyces microflavus]